MTTKEDASLGFRLAEGLATGTDDDGLSWTFVYILKATGLCVFDFVRTLPTADPMDDDAETKIDEEPPEWVLAAVKRAIGGKR